MPDASGNGPGARSEKRPVILYLLPDFNDETALRDALDLAPAVSGAGGRFIVAGPGGRATTKLLSAGAVFEEVDFDAHGFFAARKVAQRLVAIVQEHGVTLIHAHGPLCVVAGEAAARQAETAFVARYVYAPKGTYGRRAEAAMVKGRPTIAPSTFVANAIQARHKIPDYRLAVIPGGVDLAIFDPEATPGGRLIQLADRWGLTDESRPVFLLPAPMEEDGGHDVFIDACAQLRQKRGADFLGLMVGDAPAGSEYPDTLDERAMAMGCADVLKIAGACNDMPAAYRLASCVVVPATEPLAFGRVAVEAQAMGRAVIATDHGGTRDTVENGVTGALIPPGDPEALADAMASFLDLDDATRDQIGKRARHRAEDRYANTQFRAAMLDLYERVTGTAFPVQS